MNNIYVQGVSMNALFSALAFYIEFLVPRFSSCPVLETPTQRSESAD